MQANCAQTKETKLEIGIKMNALTKNLPRNKEKIMNKVQVKSYQSLELNFKNKIASLFVVQQLLFGLDAHFAFNTKKYGSS